MGDVAGGTVLDSHVLNVYLGAPRPSCDRLCDAMQAGPALAPAQLVTRNTSHFERVPGLRISHPTELA